MQGREAMYLCTYVQWNSCITESDHCTEDMYAFDDDIYRQLSEKGVQDVHDEAYIKSSMHLQAINSTLIG